MTAAAPKVSTNLPPAARKQVLAANKLIAELNAPPNGAPAAAAPPAGEPPAAQPPAAAAPPAGEPPAGAQPIASAQPNESQMTELEKAEARYKALQGKFNKSERERLEAASRLEAMAETNRLLITTRGTPAPAAPAPAPLKPEEQFRALGVTDQELKDYGPELMDIVVRVSRNMTSGELRDLKTEVAQLKQSMANVGNTVAQTAQQKVYDALHDAFGDKWVAANNSDEFVAWLDVPDVFSGLRRREGLLNAFQRADAARVVNIFKAFFDGNTSLAPTPQRPTVDRGTLVAPAPGRGAAGETPGSTGGKIWSEQEITDFYQRARKGKMPQAEIETTQAEIQRAAAEGRVRVDRPSFNH